MTLRLGWFTTARGSGSRAMFEAVSEAMGSGALDAEFAVVFCNRERGEAETTDAFFDLVTREGIPLVTRSSVAYRRSVGGERSRPGDPLPPWRIDYDRSVAEALAAHHFDVGVLAGYMLIFGREFVDEHALLNLHPALPEGPAGTWQEVIRTLIRQRATESGVMVHLAVAEVDAGPVVAYCRYPLRGLEFDALWGASEARVDTLDDDTLDASELFLAIRAAGVARESPFLVAALEAVASGNARAEPGRVVDAGGRPVGPVDVTNRVEAILEAAPAG